MTVINSNIAALRAQSGSRAAEKMMQTAMERLSTGKRINSAKDDAAGLAIATRQTSEVRGLAVAIRNANDGISLAQTAEGAMGEITNMLQRMKELAVQSSNGTLGASERAALQAETDQLLEQINVVSQTTSFNGVKLLDGSQTSLSLQTGPNAGDQISLSLSSVSTRDLGLSGTKGSIVTGRIGASATAITAGAMQINGNDLFATDKTINGDDTAVQLAAAINENTASSGVSARAFNSVTSDVLTEGAIAGSAVKINDKFVDAATSIQGFVDNINKGDFGVTATLNDDNSITLSNDTGADIVIADAGDTVFTTDGTMTGFVSIDSADGEPVDVDTYAAALASQLGFNQFDGTSYVGSSALVAADAITAGNFKINGVEIDAVAAGTVAADQQAAIRDAINDKTADTGVVASIDGTGKLVLSGVDGGAVRLEGSDLATLGLVAQGGTEQSAALQADSKLDISSQAAASKAMTAIDAALTEISAKRGDLGAIQNRLETTVSTLSTASTNLIDARSRTEDADFSAETTNLAKAQILSQAATAMLAQANQSGQGVLSLLR